MMQQQLREGRLVVKHADYAGFFQPHDRAVGQVVALAMRRG